MSKGPVFNAKEHRGTGEGSAPVRELQARKLRVRRGGVEAFCWGGTGDRISCLVGPLLSCLKQEVWNDSAETSRCRPWWWLGGCNTTPVRHRHKAVCMRCSRCITCSGAEPPVPLTVLLLLCLSERSQQLWLLSPRVCSRTARYSWNCAIVHPVCLSQRTCCYASL